MSRASYSPGQSTLDARYPVIGGSTWLEQVALGQEFVLTGNQTYNTTYGTLTAADVTWPDGASGHYATTSLDSSGAVLGFTVTYVGSTTKTITVTIPRNASSQVSGAMTVSVA